MTAMTRAWLSPSKGTKANVRTGMEWQCNWNRATYPLTFDSDSEDDDYPPATQVPPVSHTAPLPQASAPETGSAAQVMPLTTAQVQSVTSKPKGYRQGKVKHKTSKGQQPAKNGKAVASTQNNEGETLDLQSTDSPDTVSSNEAATGPRDSQHANRKGKSHKGKHCAQSKQPKQPKKVLEPVDEFGVPLSDRWPEPEPTPPPFRLLDLPKELRLNIWERLLDPRYVVNAQYNNMQISQKYFYRQLLQGDARNVLHLNRQIRTEVIDVAVTAKTFIATERKCMSTLYEGLNVCGLWQNPERDGTVWRRLVKLELHFPSHAEFLRYFHAEARERRFPCFDPRSRFDSLDARKALFATTPISTLVIVVPAPSSLRCTAPEVEGQLLCHRTVTGWMIGAMLIHGFLADIPNVELTGWATKEVRGWFDQTVGKFGRLVVEEKKEEAMRVFSEGLKADLVEVEAVREFIGGSGLRERVGSGNLSAHNLQHAPVCKCKMPCAPRT